MSGNDEDESYTDHQYMEDMCALDDMIRERAEDEARRYRMEGTGPNAQGINKTQEDMLKVAAASKGIPKWQEVSELFTEEQKKAFSSSLPPTIESIVEESRYHLIGVHLTHREIMKYMLKTTDLTAISSGDDLVITGNTKAVIVFKFSPEGNLLRIE